MHSLHSLHLLEMEEVGKVGEMAVVRKVGEMGEMRVAAVETAPVEAKAVVVTAAAPEVETVAVERVAAPEVARVVVVRVAAPEAQEEKEAQLVEGKHNHYCSRGQLYISVGLHTRCSHIFYPQLHPNNHSSGCNCFQTSWCLLNS